MRSEVNNLFRLKIFEIIIFISLIFLFPLLTYSAELLQINDSKTILVGDQNRSLSIKLYCTEIADKDEAIATDLLKKNFPRGTKVKIKPFGLTSSKLLAKVYNIESEIEMTELLDNLNLEDDNCAN